MSVTLHTSHGPLKLELEVQTCRHICRNFLGLAAAGKYNNTVFHRNMPGFMIQGGDVLAGRGASGKEIPNWTRDWEQLCASNKFSGGKCLKAFEQEARQEASASSSSASSSSEAPAADAEIDPTFPMTERDTDPVTGKERTSGVTTSLKHNSRGVVSMAHYKKTGRPASQFFLTYSEQPHLDGEYTPFARVIDGFGTLDRMQEVPMQGDGKKNRPAEPILLQQIVIHANPVAEEEG